MKVSSIQAQPIRNLKFGNQLTSRHTEHSAEKNDSVSFFERKEVSHNIAIPCDSSALPQNDAKFLDILVAQIGQQTQLPNPVRNYPLFNTENTNAIVRHGEKAVAPVMNFIANARKEEQLCEGLYVIDRLIDAKVSVDGEKIYPILSRFNDTPSPNVQVLLAGVYRKTQVPDAFGPLMKMLVRSALQPPHPYFDPSEEVGGAVLDYVRNCNATNIYAKKA